MQTCLFRKVLSAVMAVMLPAAVFAGDTPAAMLYTNGTTWLNGTSVPRSSAIFSGDLIQTKNDSVANIIASGSSVRILSDSLVQFQGNDVKLEHGAVIVSTSKAMATKSGEVTVSPATTGWTEFAVKDVDGTVEIAAEKGDLTISDDTGSTTLPQGQQTTRDESKSKQNDRRRPVPAATAGVGGIIASFLDSPLAIGIALAAFGGVAAWVLIQGDEPVSAAR